VAARAEQQLYALAVPDESGTDALSILVGGHLDTVSFVMNYVEFRIGYSVFRALSPPVVLRPDGTVARFPEAGSRDELCALIDSTVTDATELTIDGRKTIEIETDRGDRIRVDVDGFDTSEFAQLVPADKTGRLQVADMYVW
jgi:hypothetical protein